MYAVIVFICGKPEKYISCETKEEARKIWKGYFGGNCYPYLEKDGYIFPNITKAMRELNLEWPNEWRNYRIDKSGKEELSESLLAEQRAFQGDLGRNVGNQIERG